MIEEKHRNNSNHAIKASMMASASEMANEPLYAYPKKRGFNDLESQSRTLEHVIETLWVLLNFAFSLFVVIWFVGLGYFAGQPEGLGNINLENTWFATGLIVGIAYFVLRIVKNVNPIYYIMGEPVSDQLRDGIKNRVFTDSELFRIANATYQNGVLSKSGNLSSRAHGFTAGKYLAKMEGQTPSRIANLINCQNDDDILVQTNLDAQILYASQMTPVTHRVFKVQERIARSTIR